MGTVICIYCLINQLVESGLCIPVHFIDRVGPNCQTSRNQAKGATPHESILFIFPFRLTFTSHEPKSVSLIDYVNQ